MRRSRTPILAFLLLVSFLLCTSALAVSNATCEHRSLGEQYSEASHPHEYYRNCKDCGKKIYVGGHATKAHGSGEWGSGTCPQCGAHSYRMNTVGSSQHPHQISYSCDCGDSYNEYLISGMCSQCRVGSSVATGTSSKEGTFLYADGELYVGAHPILVPIKLYVDYSNTYKNMISMTYDYPPFASFQSVVSTRVEAGTPFAPTINTGASFKVDYYGSNGRLIETQPMEIGPDVVTAVSKAGTVFSLLDYPAYAVAYGVCNIEQGGNLSHEVKTYFD